MPIKRFHNGTPPPPIFSDRHGEIRNTIDLSLLRKGRCPWCMDKLTPLFDGGEHARDKCYNCDETFT